MSAVYERLLDSSIQAALSAIEIYNKPDFKYREQVFTIININAWELLLKAKILQDNSDDIESLYISLPNGSFKTNRSGNFLTIEIMGAMRQLTLPPVVTANLEKLIEIRDTAVHFYHDDALAYIVYTLGVASLKNFQKFASEWFGKNLCEYNFYILPLSFSYNFQTLSILDLQSKPDAISKLINSVTDIQANINGTDDFHFICEIKTQIILPKKSASADFTTVIDQTASNAPTIIKTQRLTDKYPLSYTQVRDKVIAQKPEVKSYQLNQFIKKYGIKQDPKYCAYNFRTKAHREKYEQTGHLPTSVACLYNEDAVRYIVDNIDNES